MVSKKIKLHLLYVTVGVLILILGATRGTYAKVSKNDFLTFDHDFLSDDFGASNALMEESHIASRPKMVKYSNKELFGAQNRKLAIQVGSGHWRHHYVVGGADARQGAWPSIVSVQSWRAKDGWRHLCGGAIINERVIATAAHCLMGFGRAPMRVCAGWLRLAEHANPHQQNVRITNVLLHPDYDPYNGISASDIGLVKLAHPLSFNRWVSAAKLSTDSMNNSTSLKDDCRVAGWGRTDGLRSALPPILQTAPAPLVPLSLCRQHWAINAKVEIPDSCLCVFSSQAGTAEIAAVCNGDSGGPLMCGDQLVGLVSWGRYGCQGCSPDVYTSIAHFRSWILQQIST